MSRSAPIPKKKSLWGESEEDASSHQALGWSQKHGDKRAELSVDHRG